MIVSWISSETRAGPPGASARACPLQRGAGDRQKTLKPPAAAAEEPSGKRRSPGGPHEVPNVASIAGIATDQVISYANLDEGDQLAVGRDVSPGGIRFEAVGCEIDPGETIRVTFNVGDQTVVAVGRVSWATEIDPITLDVGLEFIDIDPDALRMIEDATESFTPF